MKKHIRFFIRSTVLVVLIVASLLVTDRVLVPKFFYDNDWPSTASFRGFYDIEENTVDVLFLGSSHTVSSFYPQELYNEFGITSYNLGSEQQNLLVSYYWLKEALRFQKPKAVVLDTYICFEYEPDEPLNSLESSTRRAMDYMRWSPVKREAVRAIAQHDGNQQALSYYLPNLRYHTRWVSLDENDFTMEEMERHNELKGYSLLGKYCYREEYEPFEAGSSDEKQQLEPLMEEYMTKIVGLCQENGIPLILVKTPSTVITVQRYNGIREFAETYGLDYYDFNEKEMYTESGFEFAKDNNDHGHANLWGAKKLTGKIGEILSERYGLQSHKDEQWESTKAVCQDMEDNAQLIHIEDPEKYLSMLKKERYTVFFSVRKDGAAALVGNVESLLSDLGLKISLHEQWGMGYYAIISSEGIAENIGVEKLEYCGTMRDGRSSYFVTSGGIYGGDTSSIYIDGREYSKNIEGLNIVVYDNICKKVIDTVCLVREEDHVNVSR